MDENFKKRMEDNGADVNTQKLQDMVKELEEVYQRFQGIIAEYAV